MNNDNKPARVTQMHVWSLEACDTCNMQSDLLAAASCEVTMADSLQVMAINKTEINYMWFGVRQPEKKKGGRKNETASCCDEAQSNNPGRAAHFKCSFKGFS